MESSITVRVTLSLLIISAAVLLISGEFYGKVAQVSGSGRSVYIPVKRELLQMRLNQFKGPTLYLPKDPPFFDQPTGTHPLLIDFGNLTFENFVDSEVGHPESRISTSGIEVAISIPYLSLAPDEPGDSTLGLAVLYDASRGVIPQVDFIYRYFPVSEITLHGSSLYVRNNDDELRIDFVTVDECGPADVDSSYSASYSVSFSSSYPDGDVGVRVIFSIFEQPNFDFCFFYPFENDFCETIRGIEGAVENAGGNVCGAWNSDNEVYCETTAEVSEVSGIFRVLIPIQEATDALAVYQYYGDYYVGIGVPCV